MPTTRSRDQAFGEGFEEGLEFNPVDRATLLWFELRADDAKSEADSEEEEDIAVPATSAGVTISYRYI